MVFYLFLLTGEGPIPTVFCFSFIFIFYVTLLHETLMILESRCFHFWQSTNFYIILTANFDDETVNKISVLKFEHEEAGNTL